jgi:hypothetical protein
MALADEHDQQPLAPQAEAPLWPTEEELAWLWRWARRLLFAGAVGVILGGLGASIQGSVDGPAMMGWGGFALALILMFTRWGRSL